MPKTRKASSLVTVLKGTDIIYDPDRLGAPQKEFKINTFLTFYITILYQ